MKFHPVYLLLLTVSLLSCGKSLDEDIAEEKEALRRDETVMTRVASNIGFFRDLAKAYSAGDEIVSVGEEGLAWPVYWLDGGYSIAYPDPSVEDVVPPVLSIVSEGEEFFWSVNGKRLTGTGGSTFPVSSSVPVLTVVEADWVLSVGGERFVFSREECLAARKPCVRIETGDSVVFTSAEGSVITVGRAESYEDLITRDVNRAFYKDLFLDAGVGLSFRKQLPAVGHLKISAESLTGREEENAEWQRNILGGSPEDTNGRLLYPDGQPRYRVLFVNGGSSRTHGKAMGDQVISRMRTFHANGGSYVGTCAGGFFASTGYDDQANYPYYLHLWPGVMTHTGLAGVYTGFFIEEASPLLQYYDFGGDHYVADVRQNLGGFAGTMPAGTEVLARYDFPDQSSTHNKPSVWAYKASERTGRVIMDGGHPEEISTGERLHLTAAMILYALDGQGQTTLKSVLRNGQEMDMSASDARIGDLQCHHFAFRVPEDAGAVDIAVSSTGEYDWVLSLSRDGFAYSDTAEFVSDSPEMHLEALPSGMWYLSVRCMTTVTVTETEMGQDYSGRTDILNGAPYSVRVSWEEN